MRTNSTGRLREMRTKGGGGLNIPKILRTSFMYGPLTLVRFDLTDNDQKKRLQLMDELFRQFGVTNAFAVLTLFFPPKLRPLLEAVTGSKKRFKRQFREEIQRNINRLNI